MHNALTIAIIALLVAACAGQPDVRSSGTAATPVATAAPGAASGAKPVAASGAAPATTAVPHVTGYVRVVKGGVTRYCRDSLQTGSHLIVQTTCLSEQEFAALADQTRRDVERVRNTMTGSTAVSGGH